MEPSVDQFRSFVHSHERCSVIGMDFLSSGCCVLELYPDEPLLGIYRKLENTDERYRIRATVEVDGARDSAFVDSGATACAVCSPQDADKKQLQTEELEEPIPTNLLFGTGAFRFKAREVPAKGLGKQVKGDVKIFPDTPFTVGMGFLQGSTITSFEGGHWDIAVPSTEEEETSTAAATSDEEEEEDHDAAASDEEEERATTASSSSPHLLRGGGRPLALLPRCPPLRR